MNSRLAIALAIVFVIAGCQPNPRNREATGIANPAWRARPLGGAHPIDPQTTDDQLLAPSACARCHAAIVEEWAASRHALAWTNDTFQREYRVRPQQWCVNCHAPLTTQQRDLTSEAAARGVDCASCHVRQGKLVSARRRPRSPHATVVDASFGSPAYCADCHEFAFPVLAPRDGAVERFTPHPMQDTVTAFGNGPFAREPTGCLYCHGGGHGHAFPGAHDRDMLTAAVEVRWCRGSDDTIAVTVRNANAGHPIPTGDVHRHMYLKVWLPSAPEAMFQAYFGRRYEPTDDGGKRIIWDSTIAPATSRQFRIAPSSLRGGDDRDGTAASEPISLELEYVYLAESATAARRRQGEPATTAVVRQRATFEALPPCGGQSQVPQLVPD